MIDLLIPFLQTLACVGYGAAILKALGLLSCLSYRDVLAWSFALGFGTLGWIIFFIGVLGSINDIGLGTVIFVGCCGMFFLPKNQLREDSSGALGSPLGNVGYMLLAVLGAVLFFDLVEGLSPPADADSMAYHFDLPKQFYLAGKIEFVPRAADGAIPLLTHMTYLTAYGLGGERALTLWTMISNWGAAALLYALLRRHIDQKWSLAFVIAYLTTPAILSSGGTGHIEPRTAMFVLVAAMAISAALFESNWRYVVIGGLSAGFFVGSKFSGLVFATAALATLSGFLVFNRDKRWFSKCLVFGLIVLGAGGQWYVWNWLHTGDPLFPLLFKVLEIKDYAFWDLAHHQSLAEYVKTEEQAVPKNLYWFFAYPFVATFGGPRVFEAGRIGMGPLILLLLPFAISGFWRFKDRVLKSQLFPIAMFALISYTLWFFFGPSQRVRHLLPIYPLVLALVTIAAVRWSDAAARQYLLAAFLGAVIVVQLGGQVIFSVNPLRYAFTDESRDAYLTRNLGSYPAVKWVNENLKSTDRPYLTERNLNYHITVPIYYAHFTQEALTDIRLSANDPVKLLRQLLKLKITHLLINLGSDNLEAVKKQWVSLVEAGCIELFKTIEVQGIGSRALQDLSTGRGKKTIYRMTPEKCSGKFSATKS